jgi:pyruvate kinase
MDADALCMKHTKIVCTLGPASHSSNMIRKLLRAGMNAARINTAHGTLDEYEKMIDTVNSVSDIPVIVDIKGPELRLRLENELQIAKNGTVSVGFSPREHAYFSANCIRDISIGDMLLIKDGTINAKVIAKKKGTVTLRLSKAAVLKPNSNVTVFRKTLHIPSLSVKDRQCIKMAVRKKVAYIALSYARNKQDIDRVRRLLGKSRIGIIAKIESDEGVKNIKEIIEHADAIMVARGDLGVQLPLQEVPLIQKMIIDACNQRGKPVITATQMLESMMESARPTRAEVSDIANAILDGTDAVMLSGETAIGKYPVQAVEVMTSIAREIEPQVTNQVYDPNYENVSDAISKSVYELVHTIKIDKVICLTDSGYTARMVARFHSDRKIIALTPDRLVKQQLNIMYAVRPYKTAIPARGKVLYAAQFCLKHKLISKKDVVVFTAGIRTKEPHTSNLIEIHNVAELLKSE